MCDLRQRIEQKIDDIRYRVGREIDGYWLLFAVVDFSYISGL